MDMQRGAADRATDDRRQDGEALARGLGWMSVALGATQVTTPGLLGRMIGVGDGGGARGTLRALGMRELAHGVSLLVQPERPVWRWARVAGDLIDLGLLGAALTRARARRRVAIAFGAALGIAALDLLASRRADRRAATSHTMIRAVTVRRGVDDVEAWWRALEDPPDVRYGGSVTFVLAPDGRSTEVRVEVPQRTVPEKVGAVVGAVLGRIPEHPVGAELRRIKQQIETGEVARSDASVHRRRHPGQPSRRTGGAA